MWCKVSTSSQAIEVQICANVVLRYFVPQNDIIIMLLYRHNSSKILEEVCDCFSYENRRMVYVQNVCKDG